MKFLIPTEPDDSHALFVKLALEEQGHEVRLLFTADLPTRQTNSVFIDNHDYQWRSMDGGISLLGSDEDVVWWRRARKPFIPKEVAHPDDYKFITRENRLFHESITYNMAPEAWWVNPKDAALRANSKLLQLKVAVECGMTIPVTLCSNNPQDIRYFLLKHDQNGVIYKPLCSNFWFDKKQLKISYTAKIDFLDLPNNNLLQLTPGIFQREVKKKYELRVTCFGDYLVTAKLHSQQHKSGKIDWRAIPQGKMAIEPYQLPTALENQIRQFMNQMGLVFGCLDFIVAEDGSYVFLEVNEQGQFLWIEDYNPDFPMLDIFVNFLQGKNVSYQWKPKQAVYSMQAYHNQVMELMKYNLQHHVELNSEKVNNN